MGATVRGPDGDHGTVDALIVDPTTDQVTSLVVSRGLSEPRVLVSATSVVGADPDAVTVDLDAAALDACEAFDEIGYDRPQEPWTMEGALAADPSGYFLEPFVTPIDPGAVAGHERIPRGEVAVRRGTPVRSSDGTHVGHVDELLVDPADGHVTHVVLREHHLLGRDQDVCVPVGRATTFEPDLVVVDLDVAALAALEHVPVKRHHHLGGG